MPSPQPLKVKARKSGPPPKPGSTRWALFLDVDGTLLDIAPRPESVVVPRGLNTLLHRLRRHTGGASALVSGRQLSALDALFDWKGCDAAGCHGAELRLGGQTVVEPEKSEWLASITPDLSAVVAAIPGAYLELKGYSAAVHFRGANASAQTVRELVEATITPVRRKVRLLPGKYVLELLPKGVGKRTALLTLLRQPPYQGRIPVFAGDDATDEEAFDQINQLGGFTIAIGRPGWTAAQFTLPDPRALRQWLREIAHVFALADGRR